MVTLKKLGTHRLSGTIKRSPSGRKVTHSPDKIVAVVREKKPVDQGSGKF